MANPVISVVLPTYNRPQYIVLSIKSILNQDYPHYEILVLDDASTDNTEEVVRSFKDKRVLYIKNKKNIGYGNNLKKGFTMAKGKYVFLLSDDDIILKKDTFSTIVKEMDKKNAGFGQIGLMYYDKTPYTPTSLDHIGDKIFYEKPGTDILLRTLNWHFGFISGNIFRKDFYKKEDIIDDVWFPYFKYIYRSIIKNGCVYLGKHYIVARISTSGLIKWLDVGVNKGFYMNTLFEIYKQFDQDNDRYGMFVKNRLDFVLSTFPGIKYYTSNENIRIMTQEILRNRPEYFYESFFWRQYIAARYTPKFILGILRRIRLLLSGQKMNNITSNIQINKHLHTALAGTPIP